MKRNNSGLQFIVMTSDRYVDTLRGFQYLFSRLGGNSSRVDVCGFTPPEFPLYSNFEFHSIGEQSDYPAQKWSNALHKVLVKIAEPHFILMLEDYWLTRKMDIDGIEALKFYMQSDNRLLKIDLAADRLNIHGGGYFAYNQNTMGHYGHFDLIESPPKAPYNMSLWGGMWSRDLLDALLLPDETAQEIELRGSGRVDEAIAGGKVKVIGTRQQPMPHANIWQSGKPEPIYKDIGWEIDPYLLKEMKALKLLPQINPRKMKG